MCFIYKAINITESWTVRQCCIFTFILVKCFYPIKLKVGQKTIQSRLLSSLCCFSAWGKNFKVPNSQNLKLKVQAQGVLQLPSAEPCKAPSPATSHSLQIRDNDLLIYPFILASNPLPVLSLNYRDMIKIEQSNHFNGKSILFIQMSSAVWYSI